MGSLDVYIVTLQWKQHFWNGTCRMDLGKRRQLHECVLLAVQEDLRTAKRLGRMAGWNGMEEREVKVRG